MPATVSPGGSAGTKTSPVSPLADRAQTDGTDLLSGAEGRHTRTTQDMARFRNELVTRFLCRRCVNEHIHELSLRSIQDIL